MKLIRSILVVTSLGLAWFSGCGGPERALLDLSRPVYPRPSHFGFSLPYPVSGLTFATDSAIATREPERFIPLSLQIDSHGRVTAVEPTAPADQDYARYWSGFLQGFRFEPGLSDGEPVAMTLLIDLQAGGIGSEPEVRFPVDPNRAVRRSDLYWRAFGKLGVEVPKLVSFPSYNYRFGMLYRWRRYPYKVYRVELDSLGKVERTELSYETSSAYSNQIKSAIHWGDYSPLTIDGCATESSCFIIVSLYPMVDYPTKPLFSDSLAAVASWDRARVQLVPDTVGLLLPPVPKREWSGELLDSFHHGLTPELVSNRLVIDSSGQSRLGATSTDFHRARRILLARSHDIMFFPAMSLNGSTQPFEDLVYLRYLDASNVRIWFNWLGGSDPGSPTQDTIHQ